MRFAKINVHSCLMSPHYICAKGVEDDAPAEARPPAHRQPADGAQRLPGQLAGQRPPRPRPGTRAGARRRRPHQCAKRARLRDRCATFEVAGHPAQGGQALPAQGRHFQWIPHDFWAFGNAMACWAVPPSDGRCHRASESLEHSTSRKIYPLVLRSGHSLGGALATLAAIDLQKAFRFAHMHCYTFGAPRTGNHAFANEFEREVPDCWHVINNQARLLPTRCSFSCGSAWSSVCGYIVDNHERDL